MSWKYRTMKIATLILSWITIHAAYAKGEPYADGAPETSELQGIAMPAETSQSGPIPYAGSSDLKKYASVNVPVKQMHHRRRKRKCRDRRDEHYCEEVLHRGKCDGRRGKRCRKTCGHCSREKVCEDTMKTCIYASTYTCSQFWFALGCKNSCNLCEGEMTTKATVTTTAVPEECKDTGLNCDLASKYTCGLFWFQYGCKRSCGLCIPEKTTLPITSTAASTTSETTPRATTTEIPSTGVESTPKYDKTTANTETTDETTALPTEEPLLCVDQDEKNCHVWESLGLCYNPQFMEDTIRLCPRSCKICTEMELAL